MRQGLHRIFRKEIYGRQVRNQQTLLERQRCIVVDVFRVEFSQVEHLPLDHCFDSFHISLIAFLDLCSSG